MITGIAIENFKGIGERIELKLRPLTLLFGPNSSGKSSILHALQYAAEVFERRNLDAGLIGNGAAGVDLGGFHNFVHGHDANRDVYLGITFSLEPDILGTFTARSTRDIDEPSTLFHPPKQVRVGLVIGWSRLLESAFVRKYAITLDEHEFAEIVYEPGTPDCELSINERHPALLVDGNHSSLAAWHPLDAEDLGETSVLKQLLDWACHTKAISAIGPAEAPYTTILGLIGQRDALPDFERPLAFDADWDSISTDPQLQTARLPDLADYLTEAISQLVNGPTRWLKRQLSTSRFLGPIREVPPRHHVPSRHRERDRWPCGLAAWDRLETAGEDLVQEVSSWLGDENYLNAGYHLRLKRYKELDVADPLVVQLQTGRAFDDLEAEARLDLDKLPVQTRLLIVPTDQPIEFRPSDVGIGISQVVPVIVTALDGNGRLLAIEQPELHLHPRLQADLGDLFIEAALGRHKHLVILETHSELLPLRLMRRISEAAEEKLPAHLPDIRAEDVGIYYVEAYEGATVITPLALGRQGQLLDPWPDGFFEEGYRERFSQ